MAREVLPLVVLVCTFSGEIGLSLLTTAPQPLNLSDVLTVRQKFVNSLVCTSIRIGISVRTFYKLMDRMELQNVKASTSYTFRHRFVGNPLFWS